MHLLEKSKEAEETEKTKKRGNSTRRIDCNEDKKAHGLKAQALKDIILGSSASAGILK